MKFFKTIVPAIERAYYSFISVDRKSKILAYGNGISMVYDENWNVLDKRAEFQARNPAPFFYMLKKRFSGQQYLKIQKPTDSKRWTYNQSDLFILLQFVRFA